MSDDEKERILGRAFASHAKLLRELGCLKAKSCQMSDDVTHVIRVLSGVASISLLDGKLALSDEQNVSPLKLVAWPSAEEIVELSEQRAQIRNELQKAEGELRDLGMEDYVHQRRGSK